MKVQRVYIDTSVIGGCFDPEFAPWSNGLMKDFRLGNYNSIVSEIVAAEVKNAPENVQKVYAASPLPTSTWDTNLFRSILRARLRTTR